LTSGEIIDFGTDILTNLVYPIISTCNISRESIHPTERPHKKKSQEIKSLFFQSKSKIMWKMFEAAHYTRCDEYIGGSDNVGASSGDRSVNCVNQLSRLQQLSLSGGHSAYHEVQRNAAHHKEEATQVKNESESPSPAIPWNAFPDEQMAQLPVSPTNMTRIHQEETSSTDDIGDKSKIAKGGIAPRTRRLHRASRPGDLQRRKHTTRVNKSVEAGTLEGARQKQVQPEAPKALPPLPLESQQGMDRDDSKKAIEAKVGFRRRQCTRPMLVKVDSRRKVKVVSPAA
jgi:hypothetical protein